jgi:hypothetical protein
MRKPVPKIVDPATAEKQIKWPPIVSADGDAIRVGALLYEPDVSLGKYDDKRYARSNVYRVMRVDPRYRTVRARCAKGCETLWDYNKGCSRAGVHTQLFGARAAVKALIDDNVAEMKKGIEDIQKRLAKVKDLKVTVERIPVELAE